MVDVITLINENVSWVWDMFAGATLRTSLLLLLVIVVLPRWKRSSSAQRHLIWSLACASVVGIPLIQLALPAWNIPVLPAISRADGPSAVPGMLAEMHNVSSGADIDASLPASSTASASYTASSTVAPSIPVIRSPGLTLLLTIWLIGILCIVVRAWNTHRRIQQLVATSVPVTTPRILDITRIVRRELGVDRHVAVRYQHWEIPFVYGVLRPTIMLPFSAETWDSARLRDVLIHEVAHVKRWDGLTQFGTSIVCAVYWFNPFVWVATRSLQAERESACDDYVLGLGTKPSDYATHLLEFTNSVRESSALVPSALAFSHPPKIQDRLHAIIEPDRRRAPVTYVDYMLTCAAIAGVVISLSAFTLVPKESGEAKQREMSTVESVRHMKNTMNKPASDLPVVSTPTHLPMNSLSSMKRLVLPTMIAAMVSTITPIENNAQGVVAPVKAREGVALNKYFTFVDSTARPIRIRGASSITAESQQTPPLVVIDGWITDIDAFKELNVNNILKINILKGEAAIKKYGAAAEGGVLEITTGTRSKDTVEARWEPDGISDTHPVQKLSDLLKSHPLPSQSQATPATNIAPEAPIAKLSDLLKGDLVKGDAPPTSEKK